MAAKIFLIVLVIFSLLAAPWAYTERRRGFRGVLTRTEQHINFTRAARSSHQRLSMLAARLDAAAAASGRVSAQTPLQLDSDGNGYDVTLSIGTPPQKLSAVADTGSDLVWFKCGACKDCTPEDSPSYFPNKSSSFSKLPSSDRLCSDVVRSHCGAAGGGGGDNGECDYACFYGDVRDPHHYSMGVLGTETFTLGSDAVRGIGFGCTNMSEGQFGTSSGLVGLGSGSLSLVSQLRAGAFSYCLDRDTSKESPLLFGAAAVMSGPGIQTTPLLPIMSPFYSVDLQRISVGAVETPGPGAKGYGTVFDSGSTLTLLSEPAYSQAKKAMLNQTNLPRAAARDFYDMCFHTTSNAGGGLALGGAVPKMVLHFDGADMALPLENYFVKVDRDVICWVVRKSASLSIIGNIMQMNYHIKYDVDRALVAFQPANCSSV